MEHLLTAIIDRLEEHGRELGLSYIDEEYGQVEMLDSDNAETYPVTFPAVLVDSSGEQWQQLGVQHQKGLATVNVNIYIDCYHDTHAYSNTRHRVAERMGLVRSITELLQGVTPIEGITGVLTRTATTTSTNAHGIKMYQVTFTTPVYESFDRTETHEVQTVTINAKLRQWGR